MRVAAGANAALDALFLGEGPFAFTAALRRRGAFDGAARVVCTCFETGASSLMIATRVGD
jgi:hypothetical protein